MQIKKKLNSLIKVYIYFFSYILFTNIILFTPSAANSFIVSDLEISEPFELNFNKEKVIDKGFKQAFNQLISKITTSGDKKKIENTKLKTIKGLIDSFRMSNERFVSNNYYVNFDVNFNKKNTLDFMEKNNIFPSIPQEKKLLLLPILVDLQKDKIFLFNKNIFYNNWNENIKKFHFLNYLLPNEDIEDINLLLKNSKSIEDYNFKEIIKKYDINDFIITIIYKNKDNLRVLSKIQFHKDNKIYNTTFNNINLSNREELFKVINNLKISYENYWKSINRINTSIKLPLTISINSKEHQKIKKFENAWDNIDLVSTYDVSKINNQRIFYKIIYNGSPNQFLNDLKIKDVIIMSQNQLWEIQ